MPAKRRTSCSNLRSEAFFSFVEEEEEDDTPHYMFDIVNEHEDELKATRSQQLASLHEEPEKPQLNHLNVGDLGNM